MSDIIWTEKQDELAKEFFERWSGTDIAEDDVPGYVADDLQTTMDAIFRDQRELKQLVGNFEDDIIKALTGAILREGKGRMDPGVVKQVVKGWIKPTGPLQRGDMQFDGANLMRDNHV